MLSKWQKTPRVLFRETLYIWEDVRGRYPTGKTWLVPEFAELSPPSKNMKMPVERQIFWEITSLLWKFLLRQSHLLLKGTPLISCGCKWVSLVYFWCHESAFLIPGHWMIWSCGLPGSVTASRDMWRLKLLIVRSSVYRGSRVMVSIIFVFFEFSPWIHFFGFGEVIFAGRDRVKTAPSRK